MIDFTKRLAVEQLTLRGVAKPNDSENPEIGLWTQAHLLSDSRLQEIHHYLEENGRVRFDWQYQGATIL